MKIENIKSLFDINIDKLDRIIGRSRNPQNTTKKWLGSDSEYKFTSLTENNNRTESQEEKYRYWKDKEIEYKFNNYGFRTPDDFDFENGDKGILTLGCSYTEGVGLPIEYMWGYKLAKKLNLKYYNCALGGQGLHTAFRMLLYYGRRLNFDDIFLLVPPKGRYEHVIQDNELLKSFTENRPKHPFNFGSGGNGYMHHSHLKFKEIDIEKAIYAYHFGSRLQIDLNELIFLSAIESLAKELGKNLYIHTAFKFGKQDYKDEAMRVVKPTVCKYVPARDGHFPSTSQHWIFENFLQDYYEAN